ncbi:probable quinone oxidoreductase [Tanacetum coccineum]
MELKSGLSAFVTGGASGIEHVAAAFEKHVEAYTCIGYDYQCGLRAIQKDQTDGLARYMLYVKVSCWRIIAAHIAMLDLYTLALTRKGIRVMALPKSAQMESGKTVLVTAAAGGTGQFAVQFELSNRGFVGICLGEMCGFVLMLTVRHLVSYGNEPQHFPADVLVPVPLYATTS